MTADSPDDSEEAWSIDFDESEEAYAWRDGPPPDGTYAASFVPTDSGPDEEQEPTASIFFYEEDASADSRRLGNAAVPTAGLPPREDGVFRTELRDGRMTRVERDPGLREEWTVDVEQFLAEHGVETDGRDPDDPEETESIVDLLEEETGEGESSQGNERSGGSVGPPDGAETY